MGKIIALLVFKLLLFLLVKDFCCVTVDCSAEVFEEAAAGRVFVFQDFLPGAIELLDVDAVVEVGVVGVPRKRRDLAILWCELVFFFAI